MKKSTLTVLTEARKLIERPENWCQRYLARLANGSGRNGSVPDDAIAFCMNGALMRAAGGNNEDWMRAIDALTRSLPEGEDGTINFNDGHEHDEVLAVFDRAIQAERAIAP